jgi:hypothetical protein
MSFLRFLVAWEAQIRSLSMRFKGNQVECTHLRKFNRKTMRTAIRSLVTADREVTKLHSKVAVRLCDSFRVAIHFEKSNGTQV